MTLNNSSKILVISSVFYIFISIFVKLFYFQNILLPIYISAIGFFLTILGILSLLFLVIKDDKFMISSLFGITILLTFSLGIFSVSTFYRSGEPTDIKITRLECLTLANCSDYNQWNKQVDENINRKKESEKFLKLNNELYTKLNIFFKKYNFVFLSSYNEYGKHDGYELSQFSKKEIKTFIGFDSNSKKIYKEKLIRKKTYSKKIFCKENNTIDCLQDIYDNRYNFIKK